MDKELGKRLRDRRRFLDITMEELAKRAGFKSKQAISNIENGHSNCSEVMARNLARALGVSFEWLWDGVMPEESIIEQNAQQFGATREETMQAFTRSVLPKQPVLGDFERMVVEAMKQMSDEEKLAVLLYVKKMKP